MIRQRITIAILALAPFAASMAQAAPIVAGPTVLPGRAIQDITLLAGTPFNPTNEDVVIHDVYGDGQITINRSTQVGDTIAIATLSGGQYYGSNAALGSYVFGNVPPLTGADFNGEITGVVQDPNDPGYAAGDPSSFQSGHFSFGGASFGFTFLTGPAAGLSLYTDPTVAFRFAADFDGLPPSAGTVLLNSGPDVLNVLFNGQVVATSSNRRIVLTAAVPEPTSLALACLGAVAAAASVQLRKRARS
jgi:hypothetical protein